RAGLSPHSPFSAGASLIKDVGELASELRGKGRRTPVAIHVAETEAELLLLASQEGPLVTFLQELGAWDARELVPGPDFIVACFDNYGAPPLLLIHANYLMALPAARDGRDIPVVYCPRTHHAFGHPPHPFRAFQLGGTSVALGTDSLASNPDLDVLAEARFVHALAPDVPMDVLLGMATLTGAKALQWDNVTGSVTPGKSADLVILPLPDTEPTDPHSLVLESSLSIKAVVFRGALTFATDKGVAGMWW
ncbi:MAG TPA: amidohydrolase family protein, partial [Gemmataceae bacterium]|nr:amidohydrolase family protein [Gemmataceae bacterium]